MRWTVAHVGPSSSACEGTTSGENCSRSSWNSASRCPSSGSCPALKKPLELISGRFRKSKGPGWSNRQLSRRGSRPCLRRSPRYVSGYGHVEIGDQEGFGFVIRAIGYGGLAFEDDTPETLAEAMAVRESGLSRLFAEQGIELN